MSISRSEIEEVLQGVNAAGLDTSAERNAARRSAVEDFLQGKPNAVVFGGRHEHEMILDDLESYVEWEKDERF